MEMCATGLCVWDLLEKLSTINEDNLDEMELHLYALRGLICYSGEMLFVDLLIDTYKTIVNCKYNENKRLMLEEIENFKRYIKG